MKLTRLERRDLCEERFENVAFILYAEPGAMFEPGVVYFVTYESQLYGFSYLHEDFTLEDVLPLFPALAQCRFGAFGRGSQVPRGWNYLYLGMGIHLVVEESAYPAFSELILDYTYANEIYRDWRTLAEQALTEGRVED